MEDLDIFMGLINRYLENQVFELYYHPNEDVTITTNVRVEINGAKELLSLGEPHQYFTYTLYILPSNELSDLYMSTMSGLIKDNPLKISTTSFEYYIWRQQMDAKLTEIIGYYGIHVRAICNEIINTVEKPKINEGKLKTLIKEDKFDSVVRKLVKDIITGLKKFREGEYGLPEDLRPEELDYEFPQLHNSFQVYLNLQTSENVEGYDADAEYFSEDELIYVTIVYNPKFGESFIQDLIGELNELIRHELEHVKQYESGVDFPEEEPTEPESYYSQKHELGAQRAGFKRRSRKEKIDFETVVRDWFHKNVNKHKLTPEKAEKVIQKILSEK